MTSSFTGIEDVKNHIISELEANLSKERFIHTLGVAECAAELAKRYGEDPDKAELAGLLHDCAKCLSNDELLNIINTKIPNVSADELLNYKTYHAPVGEHFAKEKFKIEDREILSSIRCHTLGKVGMSRFEKIIFLADKIEARTRDEAYRARIVKILNDNEGEKGLDMALLECFKETIKSLCDRQLAICPVTIDVYNWLLQETENYKK